MLTGPDAAGWDTLAIVVWRFSDGKAGHDTQSRGLVTALSDRVSLSCCDIAVTHGRKAIWWWLRGRYPPGDSFPAPDLLIGAGHATHFHLLAARRSRGGRSVVLMKPSLPGRCFDLCLVPQHDRAPQCANLVTTEGTLNTVRRGGSHDAETGLIVLGGPSRHVRWDDAHVLRQVEQLCRHRPKNRWWLTTSRRTPASLTGRLRALKNVAFVPFGATTPDWLPAHMAQAGEVWVTGDSVSMIYEALASGASVGLLDVPARDGDSRVVAGAGALVERGWVAAPEQWQLAPGPDQPLDEAARCADWIVERWLSAS
jgi:mitochondrial fission protein ELM1